MKIRNITPNSSSIPIFTHPFSPQAATGITHVRLLFLELYTNEYYEI